MLRSLSIRNLILIDRLDLTFDQGLCVLTGETGAGKSILLEALGLALGARAEGRLLQPAAAQASVTAAFQVAGDHPVLEILSEHGLDAAEGGLILRRTVGTDGRSRAFVNDQPTSVGLLRTLGAAVLEIQGQFEQHGLLDGARHRLLLDAFGGLSGGAAETARRWQDWRAAAQACAEAERELAATRSEETHLRHAVDELEALDPQPGEAVALTEQRTRLMHREQLVEAMNAAVTALAGGSGVTGADREVSAARHHLERAAERAGGGLDPVIAALDRAAADLADAVAGLESFSADLDLEAGELARIEDRYFAFRDLARKHGIEDDRLPELRAQLRARLGGLESGNEHLADLQGAREAARQAYVAAAQALSAARAEAATGLDRAVNAELPPLKLEKARFSTRVEALEEEHGWGPDGLDRVTFEAATNPGLPPGPIGRIASGGELARCLLAIKVVLAGLGAPVTLVFDEVDSGIGGAAAHAVGKRLERLAAERQVLVVTHSPQVAARATHHWRVIKESQADRVATTVVQLDAGTRREEIARMISGAEITEEARAAAGRLMGAA
ncbi:MAG: DNA repair protein RecN [Kiloniellales bacterium]